MTSRLLGGHANQTALELFRIGLGVLILVDLGVRYTDLAAHYSSAGISPIEYGFFDELLRSGRIDLFLLSDSLLYHHAIFAVGFAAALAFCVGFKTRAAQIALFLVLLSVQNRNWMLNEGADIYVRVVLFWSLFLPLGRGLRMWRPRGSSGDTAPTPPSLSGAVALYAYSLQIAVIYLCSSGVKLQTSYWTAGLGLELGLQVDVVRGAFASWLLPYPLALVALSHMTLAIQLVAGLVLLVPPRWLKRVRLLVLLGLAGMHVGILFTLSVGLFPWYALVSLLPLVPRLRPREGAEPRSAPGRMEIARVAGIAGLALYVAVHLLSFYGALALPGPIAEAESRFGRFTGLSQHWIMFSGIEYNPVGRVTGQTRDGDHETIFEIEKLKREPWDEPSPDRRYEFSTDFSGYRWKKLYVKAFRAKHRRSYERIGSFLCRETARLSGRARFETVTFSFWHEKFDDDFESRSLAECHSARVRCSSSRVRIIDSCTDQRGPGLVPSDRP